MNDKTAQMILQERDPARAYRRGYYDGIEAMLVEMLAESKAARSIRPIVFVPSDPRVERLIDAALRLQPHIVCDREGSPETDFCMALTPFELERIRKQEVKS